MQTYFPTFCALLAAAGAADARVQPRVAPPARVNLTVRNNCSDTLWPATYTQGGEHLDITGFELSSKASRVLNVATNWDGRIWGRTNCTFDGDGRGSCMTGDCGGLLNCTGIVSLHSNETARTLE